MPMKWFLAFIQRKEERVEIVKNHLDSGPDVKVSRRFQTKKTKEDKTKIENR